MTPSAILESWIFGMHIHELNLFKMKENKIYFPTPHYRANLQHWLSENTLECFYEFIRVSAKRKKKRQNDDKAVEGIFAGYANYSKGYRIRTSGRENTIA